MSDSYNLTDPFNVISNRFSTVRPTTNVNDNVEIRLFLGCPPSPGQVLVYVCPQESRTVVSTNVWLFLSRGENLTMKKYLIGPLRLKFNCIRSFTFRHQSAVAAPDTQSRLQLLLLPQDRSLGVHLFSVWAPLRCSGNGHWLCPMAELFSRRIIPDTKFYYPK